MELLIAVTPMDIKMLKVKMDAKTKNFIFTAAIILLIWVLIPSTRTIARNAAIGWKQGKLEFDVKISNDGNIDWPVAKEAIERTNK